MAINELKMKGYTLRGVQYENNIQGGQTLQLSAKADSRINYSDENSECVCNFSVLVFDINDKEVFKIALALDAVFEYTVGDDKKELHVRICDELYSLARGIVCAFSGVAGLPPIVIPAIVFPEPDTVETA